jgi:hypothetical protein
MKFADFYLINGLASSVFGADVCADLTCVNPALDNLEGVQ